MTEPKRATMTDPVQSNRQALEETHSQDSVSAATETVAESANWEVVKRQPGDTLPPNFERYEVKELLGRGTYGCVFLAHDRDLDRSVAIKVPKQPTEAGGRIHTADEAYKAEAQRVARLDHPAIVPVYDIGRDNNGACCVISKFIEGGTLESLISTENRLAQNQVIRLAIRIAEAVHYAHESGVIHRDLKPANILLDKKQQPYVADFGVSLHEDEQSAHRDELAGTPFYMSPEQMRRESHRLDGRSDVWSIGVILYELLTGSKPFQDAKLNDLIEHIVHHPPRALRALNDSISTEVEAVVMKCLEKRSVDRYSTAADLADALRQAIPDDTSAAPLPSSGVPAEPVPSRNRLGQATAAAAMLALLGTLGIAAATFLGDRDFNDVPSDEQKVSDDPVALPAIAEGNIDVLIWDPNVDERQGVRLNEAGGLPFRENDQIRVTASLDSPAYVYVLWIDSAGQVLPLYPWTPGDWNSLPEAPEPVSSLSLPRRQGTAWPMEGGPGMETVCLLVRETPLPDDVALQKILSDLPVVPVRHPEAVAWFSDGNLILEEQDTLRGPNLHAPQMLDDPLIQLQARLSDAVAPHFTLVRTACFANVGKSTPDR